MAKNTEKDKRMAAELKRQGVERTTGRCEGCLKIIVIAGPKSAYKHVCKG